MISNNESFEEWIRRMWLDALRKEENPSPERCGWIPERHKLYNARPLPEI
jgi:hypothetical protein